MIYRLFFNIFLRWIPAEVAHSLAAQTVRALSAVPGLRSAIGRALLVRDDALRIQVFGIDFPNPVGVAGGMDKNVCWYEGLGEILGFGFVEVGTITARPQAGAEGTRVWRLLQDRGILNRMGFPNVGAEQAEHRLRKRRGTIVGVNIGKSADPAQDAGSDYRRCTRLLAPRADFIVLNVSSPNTPGLRLMQAVDPLRALIRDVRTEMEEQDATRPLLLKIGPDLSDAEIDALADLALDLKVEGIIATNTTVSREGLAPDPALENEGGGVSGAPLKPRALAVLKRLRARVGDEVVLVSVGGIEDAADVWQRILAGASLIQAHTGFVYGGPLWPRRINKGLSQYLRDTGEDLALQDMVGAGVSGPSSDEGGAQDRESAGSEAVEDGSRVPAGVLPLLSTQQRAV